jgi:hypothetical protein
LDRLIEPTLQKTTFLSALGVDFSALDVPSVLTEEKARWRTTGLL